jgi:hypothetical protein
MLVIGCLRWFVLDVALQNELVSVERVKYGVSLRAENDKMIVPSVKHPFKALILPQGPAPVSATIRPFDHKFVSKDYNVFCDSMGIFSWWFGPSNA